MTAYNADKELDKVFEEVVLIPEEMDIPHRWADEAAPQMGREIHPRWADIANPERANNRVEPPVVPKGRPQYTLFKGCEILICFKSKGYNNATRWSDYGGGGQRRDYGMVRNQQSMNVDIQEPGINEHRQYISAMREIEADEPFPDASCPIRSQRDIYVKILLDRAFQNSSKRAMWTIIDSESE
ncbi:hypothetical protein B0H10DRAFT_1952716 [Mycena sp. CBHHK59/15]|nr:hypothetical protein B0H10DRAFT_1952716 [Mycena sp. CBHHK59/15]